ncbi:MAG: hypothetical protein ACOX6S_13020 [Clostridia bacterium]|jgi:hypothetical protein
MRPNKLPGNNFRTIGFYSLLLSIFGISSNATTILLLAGIDEFYDQVLSYGFTIGAFIITLGGSLMLIARNRYGKAVVRIGAGIILIAAGIHSVYSISGAIITLIFGILQIIITGFARFEKRN